MEYHVQLSVDFENIHLPGAFIISACRKGGKLQYVKAKSLKGGILRIKIGKHKIQQFDFCAEQERNLTVNN